ncbi:hypothetical protein NP493_147g03003 [Ridgeia piscesae]|uniref:Ankyrin repeat protein n=1 Tax=Ridgeia piscesae TaxID=27915 RepID=A0AAD9UFY6_RIDPI|nr:hypothetical protein NP493_147g03003 [Ridgeia piscesae]
MAKVHALFDERRYRQVHMLLDIGHDPNFRGRDGLTLLMKCCLGTETRSVLAVVRTLLTNKADKSLTDVRGRNALSYAAIYDRVHIARIIIGTFDVDVRHKDADGNTPLHLAVEHGSDRVARMLVRILCRYRLTVDDVNNVGMTPLMIACRRGHIPLVDLLVDNCRASATMRDNIYFRNSREWLASGAAEHGGFEFDSPEARSPEPPSRPKSSLHMRTKPRVVSAAASRRRVSSAPPHRSSDSTCSSSRLLSDIKPAQPDILRDLFDIYVTQASSAYRDTAPRLPPELYVLTPASLLAELSPTSRVRKAVRQVNRADRVLRTVRLLIGGAESLMETPLSSTRQMSPTEKCYPRQMTPTEKSHPRQMTPTERSQPRQMTPTEKSFSRQTTPSEKSFSRQMTPTEKSFPRQMTPTEKPQPHARTTCSTGTGTT